MFDVSRFHYTVSTVPGRLQLIGVLPVYGDATSGALPLLPCLEAAHCSGRRPGRSLACPAGIRFSRSRPPRITATREADVVSWIVRGLLIVSGTVTGWFVSKDAPNFSFIQGMASLAACRT